MIHHRKVHGGMRTVCDICGDQLSDVNGLRRHKAYQHPHVVSDGESPVPPCPICGKQLKNRAVLYEHERKVHLGKERSDPCKFCNKVFHTGFSLRRHLATVHRREIEKEQVTVMEDKTAEERSGIRMRRRLTPEKDLTIKHEDKVDLSVADKFMQMKDRDKQH